MIAVFTQTRMRGRVIEGVTPSVAASDNLKRESRAEARAEQVWRGPAVRVPDESPSVSPSGVLSRVTSMGTKQGYQNGF